MSGIPQMYGCTHRCCMHSKKKQPGHLGHRLACDLLPSSVTARLTPQTELTASTEKNMTQHRPLSLEPPRASHAVIKRHKRMSGDERTYSFLGRSSCPAWKTPFCCRDAASSLHDCVAFSSWMERRFVFRRVCRGMSSKAPHCFELICSLQFLL